MYDLSDASIKCQPRKVQIMRQNCVYDIKQSSNHVISGPRPCKAHVMSSDSISHAFPSINMQKIYTKI